MSKSNGVVRYALLIRNFEGTIFNGTATPGTLADARKLALSILRTLPDASFIDIYDYDAAAKKMADQPLESVNLDQEEE